MIVTLFNFLIKINTKSRLCHLFSLPTRLETVADPGISKPGGGGGRSRLGRILRSGVWFNAPSHIHYVLIASVVNKMHIVNIVY